MAYIICYITLSTNLKITDADIMIFLQMRVTLEIVTVIYIIVAIFYILMESMLFRTFICMAYDVANICCTILQCMLYSIKL